MKSLKPLTFGVMSILGGLFFVSPTASAQVLNSDFGDNIAAFVYYPGYSGAANYNFSVVPSQSGLSNAPIDDWASTNDHRTGENPYGSTVGQAPFAPAGYPAAGDPAQFAFIQDANSLTQSVSLSAGAYVLSFESAPRAGNATTADATVSQGLTTFVTAAANGTSNTDFVKTSMVFVVPTSGTYVLSLNNLNPTGNDETEDFYHVTITTLPEPATYALMGVGLGALALLARLRRI